MMKPEEFSALVAKIGQNLDNQGLVTELLTQVTDTYKNQYSAAETLQQQTEEFQGKIKDLQQTNMNLFLKVAQPAPDKHLSTTEEMTYDKLLENWSDK
jgi:hypothetical protein